MKLPVIFTLIFSLFSFSQAQTPTQSNDQKTSALKEAEAAAIEVVNLYKQGKYAEALPLAQKVIEIRRRELGKNDLSLAPALRNLAYIYSGLENVAKAEDAFGDAVEVYEKNQPLPKAYLGQYAEMLQFAAVRRYKNGYIEKAEKNLMKAAEIQETLYGKDAAETAVGLLRLSQLYQAEQQDEKAAPLLLRAVNINLAKLGHRDQRTEISFLNLNCVMTKLDRLKEITEIERKVYPRLSKQEEETDPLNMQKVVWAQTIGGGVVNGKALNLVKPEYPVEAKQKRVEGTVNVQVLINEKGKVTHACAIKGPKELQRASEVASYNSLFSPTTLSGKAVKVRGVIVYNYTR